jgi:hypothetical protein
MLIGPRSPMQPFLDKFDRNAPGRTCPDELAKADWSRHANANPIHSIQPLLPGRLAVEYRQRQGKIY